MIHERRSRVKTGGNRPGEETRTPKAQVRTPSAGPSRDPHGDERPGYQEDGRHKPSSVVAPRGTDRDHLSGIRIAPNLERPTRDSGGTGDPSSPIWPCSGWGLPCGPCCQRPGALLPHPFTLACVPGDHRRSALCGTFRRLAAPGRYPAPCLAELGLSSVRRALRTPGGDSSARPPGPE